ncbi:Atu4866 domain-containing protein [Actinoplanes sp. LDG1-06]|uniref:Atu4866 domain-containing protein n=1 Tax=Paractinoplanes ovalisporus TaxID=2810368 RepID=A0ABS2AE40_9ACTN|nr:Atu4866 domain-containing protein [Actinoplanes ovalisporus]MBM2618092.1 Atu4866 domain-containing protein [Actinoplanes ovalisporus]
MRSHHADTAVLDAAVLLAGAWKSADGSVRLDIKTDGTYAGKVVGRKRRPRGTYDLNGRTLTLSDDSGLHTPVIVGDGVLEMAGHRLGRAN